MAQLPQNGQTNWGTALNNFLTVAHEPTTGKIKPEGINPGSAGQVLVTDSNGTPTWGDAQGNNTTVNVDVYRGGGIDMTDSSKVQYWWPNKSSTHSSGDGFMPALGSTNPDNPADIMYASGGSWSGIKDFNITGNGILLLSYVIGTPGFQTGGGICSVSIQKKDKTEELVLGATTNVGSTLTDLYPMQVTLPIYISSDYRLRFKSSNNSHGTWMQYRQL